ncbi:MAG: hypothetical protein IVW54_05680 [Candidatus Binataceae bacterium]|nr:hypothetical protein [Candidatus Binataceae bacterium]
MNASNATAPSATTGLSPRFLRAGGPAWYAIVAISFLAVQFNPAATIALVLGRLAPHDVYATPLGWGLTAASFLGAIAGFVATGLIANADRNQRALEISSVLAFAAGVLAFAIGWTIPPLLMWPIAAAFIVVAVSGIRRAGGLPDPVAASAAASLVEPATAIATGAAARPAGPRKPKRHRRRRRPPPR